MKVACRLIESQTEQLIKNTIRLIYNEPLLDGGPPLIFSSGTALSSRLFNFLPFSELPLETRIGLMLTKKRGNYWTRLPARGSHLHNTVCNTVHCYVSAKIAGYILPERTIDIAKGFISIIAGILLLS